MKTKYLISAALLSSLFAACTNEDFSAPVEVGQKDGRPMVEVKLGIDLGGDTDTRLTYDTQNGYQFEVGNKIGAILMDQIATGTTARPFENEDDWNELSWLQKYELVNYAHTDYPFECMEKLSNGGTRWESNAKMLEGNYFFAYPYEGYNGKRQVSHSLINQKQNGGDAAAAYESYAKNQFFIGYSQIKEGNETKDALTSVKMTSVLGGIFFKLKNIGTAEDLVVTKLVLNGNNISSVVTFDPTTAEYEGKEAKAANYNLRTKNGSAQTWTDESNVFNYANYMDLEGIDLYDNTDFDAETDFVYNIPAEEEDNYVAADALRQVVNTYTTGGNNQYAELAFTENGKDGITLKSNGANEVIACIMINPIEVTSTAGDLILDIYTTTGVIEGIDLSQVKVEGATSANTTITGQPIRRVGPATSNIIEVQFDNNSIQKPIETAINNSDDLKQYVSWITSVAGNTRLNIATLTNDAAIDAETAKMIVDKAGANKEGLALFIKSTAPAKLQIAAAKDTDSAEAKAALENILDYIIVDDACPIEVLGTANIGTATLNHDYKDLMDIVQAVGNTVADVTDLTTNNSQDLNIEVAEGGTLNVVGTQLKDATITVRIANAGTLAVAEGAQISGVTLTNEATMSVAGKITLGATSTNALNAVITVAEGGEMSATTNAYLSNSGVINNYGKVWNMTNANSNSVKPSTINVYSTATVTNIHSNEHGVIAYDSITATNAITFDAAVTATTRGKVAYTTKYKEGTLAAARVITTKSVNDYNITDLTVTEGALTADFGRPTTAGAYTAGTLVNLIVKGTATIGTKQYPIYLADGLSSVKPLLQIEGTVKLQSSIIASAFNADSYITGTVNVAENVIFATAMNAVYTGTAFTNNTYTKMSDCGTLLKGATIEIAASKFFYADQISGVADTNNFINANGSYVSSAAGTNVTVSGNTTTTEPAND